MLTLPNLLTLSRILAVPILVFLLWKPSWFDYAITFVPLLPGRHHRLFRRLSRPRAGDGVAARQFLDPIADKIMVAAVIVMLVARPPVERRPIIHDWHLIPALVILLREIIVSGLREFLASLRVSVPVSQLAKWKTTFQLVALGALILAGALPHWAWVHLVGLVSLWAAAALTLVTGWDYLRVGLKHMD